MTNIVLPPVTNGNNVSTLNDNFRKIQESVNSDLLNLDGGNNVMKQDLDMNGNDLLNVATDVNNPNSMLTVGSADSRYYNVSGDTMSVQFAVTGDAVFNGITRGGTTQVTGDWLTLNSFISVRATFTTASGEVRIPLPYTLRNDANLRAVLSCGHEGFTLPAGRTQLHAEVRAGQNYATLVASGSGVSRQTLTTTSMVSGAFVTLVLTGSYAIQR